MAEFSNEEYLRALADNGDREAAKEYEQALDNRIFQLQISLAQTSDPQGRREVQKLLEQEEKKKRDYFQEKEEKAVSEFRRRKNETTKGRKVSSFDKLKDPKIIRWVIGVVAVLAVVIPVVTLMWYSNNQKESVTNPWKNGQLAKSKEQAAASSDNQSSQVDTSSLSDQQLEDWVVSTYAKEQGSTGENYKNLIIFVLSVFKTTALPFIVHDSLIFKNIADLPIDKIMQLYVNSGKQVFISFDKHKAFTEYTAKTVYDTRVIELHSDGGELFGWSWAKKTENESGEVPSEDDEK